MIWNTNDDIDMDAGYLPNGHTRQEYYDLGFSDMEIDFWGLDQPGTPGSEATGFVIMDLLMDGDGDGEMDF